MKLNMANPLSGLQKMIEVDDEKRLLPFFERRMGAEVSGDSIGDEFKGYVFRITGGNDKQGFPMAQGVLVNHRVRLLFKTGMKCFRPRRRGQMKRKSVRGCIVGHDLAVLNLVVVRKGLQDIPGLTDGEKPRRLGPKRASHIRKLFNLGKGDDVRQFVIRRKVEGATKTRSKAPKIQRLITSTRIQRKRRIKNQKLKKVKATQEALAEYKAMMESYHAKHSAGNFASPKKAESSPTPPPPSETVKKVEKPSAKGKVVKETKPAAEAPKPAAKKASTKKTTKK